MIFLDNASTTKLYKETQSVINLINDQYFYNPSAIYKNGVEIKVLIESARKNIIKLLGGDSFDQLIFTSGATEANNFAINGSIKNKNSKLLFSEGEHPSVYNVAKNLKNSGYNVEFIKLLPSGKIDIDDYIKKLTPEVSFVSIIHVSNETGAVNDISYLSELAKQVNDKIIFHSDGVQAFGKIPYNISELGVGLYTISAHKIHGPRGAGALYIKNGINIKPSILGGGQEFGLRSGTENVSAIKGFEKSAELTIKNLHENSKHILSLCNKFIELLKSKIKSVVFNGISDSKHVISFSLPDAKAETLLHMLDDEGVLVSNGSACSSKNSDNRVLNNMGVNRKLIESSLRVSFDEFNTINEVEEAVNKIEKVYNLYLDTIRR